MADQSSKDEYFAKPPRLCCLSLNSEEGTPRGKVEDLTNVPTYIVRPSDIQESLTVNGHVLLYFPDVWGLAVHSKCIMDKYAAAGYTVVGMDYDHPGTIQRDSETDPLPPGVDHMAWILNRWEFSSKRMPEWAAAVRTRFGTELKAATGREAKFACVGYCAGATFVSDLLAGPADGEPFVSAGAFAHPAALKEEQFLGIKSELLAHETDLKEVANFVSWTEPLLLSCAENDEVFPTDPRRKAVDLLRQEKKIYHLQVFQGVGHGFASKPDMTDPYQRWCAQESLQAIIS